MKRYTLTERDTMNQEQEEAHANREREMSLVEDCLKRLDTRGLEPTIEEMDHKFTDYKKYYSLIKVAYVLMDDYFDLLKRVAQKDEKILTEYEIDRFLVRSALNEFREDKRFFMNLNGKNDE